MTYIVLLIVIFLFGFTFGFVFASAKHEGTLNIDSSDPEKDIYSFELDVPLDELNKKRKVVLKVRRQNNSLNETIG